MMPIVKKELRMLFRNAGFGWLMILSYLLPLAVFYLLFRFSGQLIQEQISGGKREKIKIAWVSEKGEASEIRKSLEKNLQIHLIDSLEETDLEEAIELDSIAAGIVIAKNFDSSIVKKEKTAISLYFKGNSKAVSTLQKNINNYKREITRVNISESNLPEGVVNPIEINEIDLSSIDELLDNITVILNNTVAILLSLLILIFGSIGARYALNKLLTADINAGASFYYQQASVRPTDLFMPKIMLGSFFSFSLIFLSLCGFMTALSINQNGIIQGIIEQLRIMLSLDSILLIFFVVMPFALLLSGFWAFFSLKGKKNLLAFISNLLLTILVFSFILFGTFAPALNSANSFLPFFSQLIFIKTILSEEISYANISAVFFGTFIWAIFFTAISLLRFKRFM